MRRVLGVAAVVSLLCWAGIASAQEGWGNPPPAEQPSNGGTWGNSGQPEQPQGTGQPAQPQGTNWNQSGSPQAADTESPTGGGATGWGNNSGQPAPQQPVVTPTHPPAAAGGEERRELTGDQFRLAHRVALGAHNHMSGAFLAGWDAIAGDADLTTPWLNFSFMYTFSRLLTLDIFLGFSLGSVSDEGDGITDFELALGPRLLFTLASGDHGRLYTGIGLALLVGLLDGHREGDSGVCGAGLMGCGGYDMFGFAMGVPIGFEYRFRRVPNLIFSAEINMHFVFESFGVRTEEPGDAGNNTSDSLYNIIVFGLGNPRQEGSMNVLDYLTFLTIGFHYLI